MHIVLIIGGKIIIDTLPGMTQQISWTLVNLIYLAVCARTLSIYYCSYIPQLSYLMFHWVTGIPFEGGIHAGAYDDLTLWEQIDDGAQYTPAKKWLLTVPIVLYVVIATLFLALMRFILLDSSPRRTTLIITRGFLLSISQLSYSC